MKYIIMADGKETRWSNCAEIHKWQIRIDGEMIIERTVRLIREFDPTATVIFTSHCKSLRVDGAERHEPKNNAIEIDRFTAELIEKDVVFLYGDCFYTENAIKTIVEKNNSSILFFGCGTRIFAIKVSDDKLFVEHINNVKKLFLEGKINNCIGWQVYQSYQGIEFDKKQIVDDFVVIDDETRDFNKLKDYREFIEDKTPVNDERPIAFFDSGIGGLTCVKAFREKQPNESVLYFGDSMRAPYGDRKQEEIVEFGDQIAEFLISKNIKLLIIACNTASALCLKGLREKYVNTPIIGMIDITAKHIAEKYADKNVGIIATSVTKKSGVYTEKLLEYGCEKNVPTAACPLFVPMIEKGIHSGPEAERVLKHELDDFITENDIEVLVLGCTHFPFLRSSIEKLYPHIQVLDPSEIVSDGVDELIHCGVISANSGKNVIQQYFTSKLTAAFSDAVKNISGNPEQNIEIINF